MYLENIVSDVVDLDNGRAALAEFRAEHGLEAWAGSDEDDLCA